MEYGKRIWKLDAGGRKEVIEKHGFVRIAP